MYYQIIKSDFYSIEVYDMIINRKSGTYITTSFKKHIRDLFKLDYRFDFKVIESISFLEDYEIVAEADTMEELKMEVMEYLI